MNFAMNSFMTSFDLESPADNGVREALLDRAFGPDRFAKTCERLREGRLPADGLAFAVREAGALVATLRFWHVDAGGVPALMLGPVAVDAGHQSRGLGGALIRHGLARAAEIGHRAVILVGDAPYYNRFGFKRYHAERLVLPGPVDPARFLGLELSAGTLGKASGLVRATGAIPLRGEEPVTDRRRAA